MIQSNVLTETMQMKITSYVIGLLACSLVEARPQNSINNYPYRPTFSDLSAYNYYTTPMPYQQNNMMRIWPYIIDQAVSPLYNWNWNGFNTGYGGGYTNNNNNNGYYNTAYGYTTTNPIWSVYNPYGTISGKK